MVERIDLSNNISETTMRYHLHQNIIRTQMYQTTMPLRAQFQEDFEPPQINDEQLNVAEFATELRETFGELSSAASELVDHDLFWDQSVFQEREVDVEDTDVLEAQVEPGAETAVYQVEVHELADSEENQEETEHAQVGIEGLAEGEDYYVREDTVFIDEGRVQLELLETGQTEVTIDHDQEQIMSGIEDFVQAFEDTKEFIEGRVVSSDMERVGERLTGLLENDGRDLEKIGIELDDQGSMTIMEEVVETSIEEDLERVEEILGDFASRVETIADEVLRTPPSRYMGEEMSSGQEEIFELDNFRMDEFRLFDQTGSSVYPFPVHQGMIFDFFL